MSLAVVLLLSVLGLFTGSLAWTIARNLATSSVPWSRLRCGTDRGHPESVDCLSRQPWTAFLPLYGFGAARRCKTCGGPQSRWRYAIDLGTAVYFAIAAWRIDDALHLTGVLIFALLLLVVLLVDIWSSLIYSNLILAGIAGGLLFAGLEGGSREFVEATLAIAAAVAIFWFFYIFAMSIYKTVKVVPFGRGDIYLAAMIAAMVRLDDLIKALILGIVCTAVGSLYLISTKRLAVRQSMPYGPFLCFGALITFIW